MQAILDNAQAEGRNITEAEEAEYLRLARLHAVAVELEGYDDDEEDA
jgi:Fe-S-cluster formation regulator IscX/YfhJ